MTVNGERADKGELSLWKDIEIIFDIEGDVDQAKAERAVQLSLDKYCSVAATLVAAGAVITPSVLVKKGA